MRSEPRQEEDPAAEYKARLKEIRKKEENVAAAIEDGGSRTLSARLAELEAEEDRLSVEISRAELVHPVIPKEVIKGWLLSFRSGDKDSPAFRKKLVETFVADVIVDNEKITIFYNIEKEPHSKCSSTARLLDFAKRCSNTAPKLTVIPGYIVLIVPRIAA